MKLLKDSGEPTPTLSMFVELAPEAEGGGCQDILEESQVILFLNVDF
jgi:hypothetical protein